MTTLNITRHMELFNPHRFDHPVTIIGAGATGSWLALMLAKLGITNIAVWDFDVVKEHNIPNQAYSYANYDSEDLYGFINMPKVEALQEIIRAHTGADKYITVYNQAFTNQRLAGIVFLMVDSMAERKRIWESSIRMKPNVKLLVEPRMGLDMGRIYNVIPTDLNHVQAWEDTLYDDDTAEVSACGASMSVITTATGIASWCARQLINFHNNEILDNEILIDFKYNHIVTTRW